MAPLMFKHTFFVTMMLALATAAHAADVTGIPKIQSADQISINNIRIKLAGIDAPSPQQLCLDAKGAPWKCGIAAHDALASQVGNKSWTCHLMRLDRRARTLAKCTVDGEDIHKWLVQNGWALAFRSMAGVLLTLCMLPPLAARIRSEETLLRAHFGVQYEAYRKRTWRLVPWVY